MATAGQLHYQVKSVILGVMLSDNIHQGLSVSVYFTHWLEPG